MTTVVKPILGRSSAPGPTPPAGGVGSLPS